MSYTLKSLQDLGSRRHNFSLSVAGAGAGAEAGAEAAIEAEAEAEAEDVDLQPLHVAEAALQFVKFQSEGNNRVAPMRDRRTYRHY